MNLDEARIADLARACHRTLDNRDSYLLGIRYVAAAEPELVLAIIEEMRRARWAAGERP